MNLTISERNINVTGNAPGELDDRDECPDIVRHGLAPDRGCSSEFNVLPSNSQTKTLNETSEKNAFSRAGKPQNPKKFPKKLGSSAPKKSFEKIVSTLSITADKITPVPLKLEEIPLEDSEERTRDDTAINFDALNEALSWDPDKSWDDSSSESSGSTEESASESTNYGDDDVSTEIRSGSYEEVVIGGSGEVLNRSVGHRTLHTLNHDHVEAQTAGSRRSRRRGGGFRSLLLLGLLLLVAVLALLTLSQVVLVEHRVLDHLGHDQLQPALPLRPGRALQRILTGVTLGGGGPSKNQKRQFKIEPLLNREAPSVEVNLARTVLKKVWTHLSTLIVEESLSIFHLREHKLRRKSHQNRRNSSSYENNDCWEDASLHDKDERRCKDVGSRKRKRAENDEHERMITRKHEHIIGKYSERDVQEMGSIKTTTPLSKPKQQRKNAYTISIINGINAESEHTNLKENKERSTWSEQGKFYLENYGKGRSEQFRSKREMHKWLNGYRLTNNDNLTYNKPSLLKQYNKTSAGGRILTVGIEKNSAKTKQMLLDRRKNSDKSNWETETRNVGCRREDLCQEKHNNKRPKDKQTTKNNNASSQTRKLVVEPNYSDILTANVEKYRSEKAIEPSDENEGADPVSLNYSMNSGDFPDLLPGNEPFGIYREDDESIMEVLEQTSFMGDSPDGVESLDQNEVSIADDDKKLEDSYEDADAMYKDFLGSGVDLPLDPLHEIELKFKPLDRLPRDLIEQSSENTKRNRKRVAHRPKLKKLLTRAEDSKNILRRSSHEKMKGKALKALTKSEMKVVLTVQNITVSTQDISQSLNLKTSKLKDRELNLAEQNSKINETSRSRNLSLCPEVPPHLQGRLPLAFPRLDEDGAVRGLLRNLSWVSPGGSWSPLHSPHNPCIPRHRVAVIVPYRDRVQHLAISLSWLHTILRSQQLEYTVYVAEQVANVTFNKGSVMNAGFLEAFTTTNAQCFVFHDVDMLAEDDRNMYSCPPRPRHLSVGVNTLQYRLPYFLLVGGVLAVRGDHFLKANGYSNMYWGWGGEDDDMGYRLVQSKLGIVRPVQAVARYSMIPHTKRLPLTWKVRGKLVRTSSRRYRLDGLNTLQYRLLSRTLRPLYTHLLLDVGTPPTDIVSLSAA